MGWNLERIKGRSLATFSGVDWIVPPSFVAALVVVDVSYCGVLTDKLRMVFYFSPYGCCIVIVMANSAMGVK